MINIVDKKDCCGCTACSNICPKKCIAMDRDQEGFLYPVVNESICVQCGACERVCPIQNVKKLQPFKQNAYIMRNTDAAVRKNSAAGGFFCALGRYVISKGGVVFGVALDDKFHAVHKKACIDSELLQFAGSKYMQSTIGDDTFIDIKEELENKRLVLFSGTPCQVSGLMAFLGREYSNLITVDLVCHSVPSPMIFDKYLEYIAQKYDEKIIGVRFRDKKYSYHFPTMKIVGEKRGEFYNCGMEADPWLRAFFANICDRPACYNCQFKSQYRNSDFTIWDCNTVAKDAPQYNDGLGATKTLVHTTKGKDLIERITDGLDMIEKVPCEIISSNSAMFKSVIENSQREQFFEDAHTMDGFSLFNKWFPITWRHVLKHELRILMNNLGIQDKVRMLKYKLKK